MTLDIRGHLNVEKVKNNKDMPAEEGRGIGYYDDCMAKLANQEEEDRLTVTMDSLHLQRTRMLADTRHELKSVDKTLKKLQNQKKLLRRATLENVISGVNKQLVFKSFGSISEAPESDDEIKDVPKTESNPDEPPNDTSACPGLPDVPIPADSSLSSYDTYWLRRRGVNPPLCARPASTKIFNETYTGDDNKQSKHKFNRRKSMIKLNNNNENDSVNSKEEEAVARNKVRPKTSHAHNARRRNSSSSSRDSIRPHTAQATGTRGRSRRELTQLTHIDAVMSSDREYRRKEWLETKSTLKAEHDRMLRKKVQSFLETIERDKKRFITDVDGNVTSLEVKAL